MLALLSSIRQCAPQVYSQLHINMVLFLSAVAMTIVPCHVYMNARSQEFPYTLQNSPCEADIKTTIDSVWMAKQCQMERLEFSENLKWIMSLRIGHQQHSQMVSFLVFYVFKFFLCQRETSGFESYWAFIANGWNVVGDLPESCILAFFTVWCASSLLISWFRSICK